MNYDSISVGKIPGDTVFFILFKYFIAKINMMIYLNQKRYAFHSIRIGRRSFCFAVSDQKVYCEGSGQNA